VAGVPKAYSLIETEGRPAMVMEDVGGTSLDKLPRMAVIDALRTGIHVGETLGQLHQSGILHKDVKPSNVVLGDGNRVQLIDYHLSSRLARESAEARNPNLLEGTLAYIAPEQTGRMNRPVDYRSDLYSLGAALFHMFTGRPPFEQTDALGLVHCHLAVTPMMCHSIESSVPPQISSIVARLLAKAPEARYQSAYGVTSDLRRCLEALEAGREIEPFDLGTNDVSARFQVSAKLYGRDEERQTLLESFGRITGERTELVLVAGYSGIGKSRLINEIHAPMVAKRGRFVSGKFDQLSNAPYEPLFDAVRQLVRDLLTESAETLAVWKKTILEAVGDAGQVLVDAVPELELVIGEQPPATHLGPNEARNRFQHIFRTFLSVFATDEHPLVVFIDDLQWADTASLDMLRRILFDEDIHRLLVLGAYRNNEVGPGHPFVVTLEELKGGGVPVSELTLSPLSRPAIGEMVADTVGTTPQLSSELGDIVYEKTGGNPFFVDQFLREVHLADALAFDAEHGVWRWDLSAITAMEITDNVAELMSRKVGAMPEATRTALELAACIGNSFDLKTLSVIAQRAPGQMAQDLWPALELELLVPLGGGWRLVGAGSTDAITEKARYRFLHDRVQEAAYELVGQADRRQMHLRIGRLLRDQDSAEDRLFDVVGQLNAGRDLITDPTERMQLARLDLQAGARARAAGAFRAADQYLTAGLECLTDDSWETNYQVAYALHVNAAETAHLVLDHERMDALCEASLKRIKLPREKAEIFRIRAVDKVCLGDLMGALHVALDGLDQMGVKFPRTAATHHVLMGLLKTKMALRKLGPEGVAKLPASTDPDMHAAVELIGHVISAAYQCSPNHLPLFVFRIIQLSLKHGNAPISAFAYSTYGLILSAALEAFDEANDFQETAHKVIDALDAEQFRCKVIMCQNTFVRLWKVPLREGFAPARDGYKIGREVGDLEYAAYCICCPAQQMFAAGVPLPEILDMGIRFGHAIADQRTGSRTLELVLQAAAMLTTPHDDPMKFSGDNRYDLDAELEAMSEAVDKTFAANLSWAKLMVAAFMGHVVEPRLKLAANIEKYLDGVGATIQVVQFHHHGALAWLEAAETYPDQRRKYLRKAGKSLKKIELYADHCAENHIHRVHLLKARFAQIKGKHAQADMLFEQAIEAARANQFHQDEGMACEMAARHYTATGRERAAWTYRDGAREAYARWGAAEVVRRLDGEFPELRGRAVVSGGLSSESSSTAGTLLDVGSILKASQVISGEIVLNDLLARMMTTLTENAGAQRGTLLLKRDNELRVFARVVRDDAAPQVLSGTPLEEAEGVARSVIRYVERSGDRVVLVDATRSDRFRADEHIATGVRSVLCTPVTNQKQLVGVLYLENNAVAGAFTADRCAVLEMLAGQAAISLDNAKLYEAQEQMAKSLARFVPTEFLALLGKESIVDLSLGDSVERDMAVLFGDVRSFTTLTEGMSTQESFQFVNDYLGVVGPIIREKGGFIDKYLGDAVMALYPNGPDGAVATAVRFFEALREAPVQLKMGVGIHHGNVMLGTIGEAQRLDGTVIADAVNIASRLEGLTKPMGVNILISGEALTRLPDADAFLHRYMGSVVLKGKRTAVDIYEVYAADEPHIRDLKTRTRPMMEAGLRAYLADDFVLAGRKFSDVLDSNPDDKAAAYYRDRAEQHRKMSTTTRGGDVLGFKS